MAQRFTDEKSAAEKIDLTFDWASFLGDGETVSSCTVTPPDALTAVSPAVLSGSKATSRLSGGVAGQVYDIVWHAVTSTNEEPEAVLRLYLT